MTNFWHSLQKPFFVLAPMEDVTDTVFRQIVASCGKPHVFMTEFTSTDGMQSKGKEKVMYRLRYTEKERPLVAQIWGKNPENIFKSAKMVEDMGFDGLDINMGCPERSIVKNGSCAALIQTPTLAQEIIHAAREGAKKLPISVKTRIGFKTIKTEEWISFLLQQKLSALTVHFRTAAEMSLVPAHWEEATTVVALKNNISPSTLIIGNGDIKSADEAIEKYQLYRIDGIMIGRGIFENPYLFNVSKKSLLPEDKLKLLIQHVLLFEETWGRTKNFDIMKKFFKMYCRDFDGASELRVQLMEKKNAEDVITLVQSVLNNTK